MVNKQLEAEALAFVHKIADLIRQDVIDNIIGRVGPTPKGKSQRHPNAKSKKKTKTTKKPGRASKLDQMTKAQQKVFAIIKGNKEPMATKDIAKAAGISGSTTLYHLGSMEKAKVIKRLREGHTCYFQVR